MIDGGVTVDLGDKEYRLSLTLAALEKIEADYGSLIEARQRVAYQSLTAICRVIAAGANLTPNQVKELKQEVFRAGVVNVAPKVNEYIIRLHDPENRGDLEETDSGED